jgi:hypothetical protein
MFFPVSLTCEAFGSGGFSPIGGGYSIMAMIFKFPTHFERRSIFNIHTGKHIQLLQIRVPALDR